MRAAPLVGRVCAARGLQMLSKRFSGCARAPLLGSAAALPVFSPAAAASGRRSFAAAAEPAKAAPGKQEPLVATGNSNVGKLAGALAARLRQNGAGTISAVGPQASYTALKAIMVATDYVANDFEGKVLAVVPVKKSLQVQDEKENVEMVGLLLDVRPLPQIAKVEEPDIYVSGSTNVGLMAGLMANVLKGSDKVTLAGMGAGALSSTLKAIIIAQGYMAESLGENMTLVGVPRYSDFFEKQGEQKRRVLVTCVRAPR